MISAKRRAVAGLLRPCADGELEAMRPAAAEEARCLWPGEDIELLKRAQPATAARISVGCVRNDYGMPEQVQFWSVADNVRFGGALMAVKIAEKLVQEYLY
jgi:aspartate-semialdehyde dehydrogenase